MYYLSAILVSFIIGLIRRGSVRTIIEHPYKKWLFGFIGLIILIILNYSFLFINSVEPYAAYFPIISFVGYLLLLLMFIFNLDDIFSILIALGLTFDFIETFINGGLMPVADSVIKAMPQNLPLTQSILNATSVTYTQMQPETLLSFLGVILPVPFFARFVVMAGTLPGLSIGKTFILVGLLGLVQAAMKLPIEKKKIMEEPERPQFVSNQEPQKAAVSANAGGNTSRFDSITEELFFEDNPLPKDPLDKIFAGDIESQHTKHIDQIKQLRKTKSETEDLSDLDREVEMLTKPLGTGIINSKEIRDRIIRGEQEEIKDEINGFFSQEFQDKNKLKTEEIFTTEEPTVVTEPIQSEKESETKESETKVFEKTETEPVQIQAPVILLSAPDEETDQVEPILNISPDIFMTQDQYNDFINSIDDQEFIQEFKYYLSQFKGEPVEEIKITKTSEPNVIIMPPPEPVLEINESKIEEVQTEPLPEVIETFESEEPEKLKVSETKEQEAKINSEESEETQPVEAVKAEEILEPEIKETQEIESKISEESEVQEQSKLKKKAKTPSRKRKRKKVDLIPEEQETVYLKILPETQEEKVNEPIESVEESKVIIRIIQNDQSEKITELSTKEINSDKIEVQETQPEEVEETMETTIEESSEEKKQVSDRLSDIVFDEDEVPEILTEDINLDLLEELIEPDHYVSSKRGSFIQDEGSGYYVNKAYKEEKANMDKSEEEMLNVWAQVSQENQKRKMSRRRQSRPGFGTYSPFIQEETEQIQVEAKPEQVKSVETAAPQKSVNAMTDEERRAAGYEYVSIDVNGKTLSFWQKKN